MNDSLKTLSLTSLLALGASIGALGCDVSEPDQPGDRDAALVVQIDGEVVEDIAVGHPQRAEADLLDLAAEGPTRVCADDEAVMDLVLEIDGDEAVSVHACAPAPGAGPDALTDVPDVQAAPYCQWCDDTNDCFACCKCDGGSTGQCANACWF